MSFYASISGSVKFFSKEDFDEVLNQLIDGEYVKDNNFVEGNGRISETEVNDIDPDQLSITIPLFHYQNLTRILDSLPLYVGNIVITTTDGCFQGYVIQNGTETVYELKDWAKQNQLEDEPQRNEFESDDEYYENLTIWQMDIETEFFCKFS